jgi:hypothetical protein
MTAELVAVWLVRLLALYAGAGLLFALVFLARGVERVDPGAHGATLGFRLVLLPATIVLWPWLWRRWRHADGKPAIESNAHRRAARERSAERPA